MFCKNCGEQISEHAEICVHCGVRAKGPTVDDKPNWAVNLLTLCCIPLVGLILYFVWKNEKPKAAKSALTFFFINIGATLLLYALFIMIGILAES